MVKNKNNNNKKKAPAQRRRRQPARRRAPGPRAETIPKFAFTSGERCLHSWLSAFKAPFARAAGVCLPVNPAPPSRKIVTYAKGTLACGTAGFGYVMNIPSVANDEPCMYYSDATFPGTQCTNAGVGVNSLNNTQSSFVAANFSATALKSRLALAAVRVRYIGTELNRGGRVGAFSYSNHADVNFSGFANLGAIPGYTTMPVDRKWHTIRFNAQYPWEMSYGASSRMVDEAGATDTAFKFGILIESSPSNQFEFEFVQYHEIAGLTHSQTPSYASAKTDGALAAINDMGRAAHKSGNWYDPIVKHAPDVLAPSIAAGKEAAGNWLARTLFGSRGVPHMPSALEAIEDIGVTVSEIL